MTRPIGLAMFASGRGSNAAALLKACEQGRIDAQGVLIVSNNEDAGVHEVAEAFGVPSRTIKRDEFTNGQAFADEMITALRDAGTDLICLAGYLRKVPPALLRTYPDAVLNIHPALLPKHGGKGMYGLRVHQSVIESGDTETGVTVHFVDPDYDTGPILHQRGGVPVQPGDTPEVLAARVLPVEHETYPEAVQKWIDEHTSPM